MKKYPLISVILPNYNHANFLEERIDTILNQTHHDFELIILDDASTDNSRDIILKYADCDKISHIVFNEVNSGSTFIQWKKGFSLAKGEYIWIAESDDYAAPTFLKKLVTSLQENETCNLAFSYSYLVDENSNILAQNWDKKQTKLISKLDGKLFIKSRMLVDSGIYNASMVLFRKSVLENISEFFISFKCCGDWFFWNQICLQGDIIRYAEKLNYFRQHSNKVTPKADLKGLKFIEGKYVVENIIKSLNLTKIQRLVVIGKYLKCILDFKFFESINVKEEILLDVKNYFRCNIFPIFIYKLDKIFNFSALDLRKNRRL